MFHRVHIKWEVSMSINNTRLHSEYSRPRAVGRVYEHAAFMMFSLKQLKLRSNRIIKLAAINTDIQVPLKHKSHSYTI